MNIKNNVSLTVAEAVELLAKLADSLEHKGEFAFDLKGQEVSIEAGSKLNALLSIKPDEFSIVFNWGEEPTSTEEDWRAPTEEQEEFHEPPKMVREVNIPERKISNQPQIKVDEPEKPNIATPNRALPDRMPLNTTTLPLDAGYWAPAFTSSDEAQWSPIPIEGELENKRWAADDQITSLSDLTPTSAKPKKSRKRRTDDDDLFSELDKLDQPNHKTKAKQEVKQDVEKVKIPENRVSAKPAARVASIPKPGSAQSSTGSTIPKPTKQNIPKAPPKTSSLQSSIPKPSSTPKSTETSDTETEDWVKPSEVLQKKNTQTSQNSRNIPTPNKPTGTSSIPAPSTKPKQGKRDTIPKPTSHNSTNSVPSPTGSKISEEVREWKEPSAEENATDDDWVRPSEFLKRSKEVEDEAVNRPPPKAPDAKDEEKDKKNKGWASWD